MGTAALNGLFGNVSALTLIDLSLCFPYYYTRIFGDLAFLLAIYTPLLEPMFIRMYV